MMSEARLSFWPCQRQMSLISWKTATGGEDEEF